MKEGEKREGAQVRGSCAFDSPCSVMETYEERKKSGMMRSK